MTEEEIQKEVDSMLVDGIEAWMDRFLSLEDFSTQMSLASKALRTGEVAHIISGNPQFVWWSEDNMPLIKAWRAGYAANGK